jgi:Tol biopolymer transport system component
VRGLVFCVALLVASATPAHGATATAEHLVFISNRDGDQDVYAVNPDGSHLAALTRNGSFESALLSPDGRHLIVERSIGILRVALVAVSSDGRHERVLARGENVGSDGFSPDGRWIAYHQGFGVSVMRVDGSDARPITSEEGSSFLDWSPDSMHLLVHSASDNLVVFDRDGTPAGVLGHDVRDAAWGSHGIAVVTDTDETERLAVIDSDGNAVGTVGALARRVEIIGWSHDGERIAAISRDLNGRDVATSWDVVTGRGEPVLIAPYISEGAWSPDGQKLAIASDVSGDGRYELDVVIPFPNSHIGTIRAVPGYAIDSFAWSPSGRTIAFSSGFQLFTANSDGNARHWLTGRADAALVGWSPGPVPKTALRARPLARPETATATLMRTQAPVAEIAADGYWAGAVVLADRVDCTHIAAWHAGTSRTMRFQFIGPCDGRPPLLYDLVFATPGLRWHEYFCTHICYDTPFRASIRSPGSSEGSEDPTVVEREPHRPAPRAQLTRGIRAALRNGRVVVTRTSDGASRAIRPPGRVVDLELERAGLFYAYNEHGHGRVVFMPFSQLPR